MKVLSSILFFSNPSLCIIFFLFIFILSIFPISYSSGIECYEYSCKNCTNSNYGSCTECRSGFILNNGTCPCYDPNCAICSTGLPSIHTCEMCKYGNVLNNKNCYCKFNNCEICGLDYCEKCITGYEYNSTLNECQEISEQKKINCFDENCETCFSETEGTCEECKEGYWLTMGKCQALIKEDNCPEGFYKRKSYCYPWCDGIDCQQLIINYIISAYECNPNKCLVCEGGVLKIYSGCDDSKYCNLSNCLTCLTDNECIFCSTGTFLRSGKCIPCPDGCISCKDELSCDTCLSGYELIEGMCVMTGKINWNEDVYKKVKNALISKYYPEEIVIPDPTPLTCGPHCSICVNGVCQGCEKGYFYKEIDNLCEKCNLSNCEVCGEKNCLKCEEGYKLDENGLCIIECDENCKKCMMFNQYQICQECEDGYELDSGYTCKLICSDKNCNYCTSKNNCIKPKSGYYILNGRVLPCYDILCSSCDDGGINSCKDCKSTAKLINGKCANRCFNEELYGCEYCTDESYGSECLSCREGCTLTNSGCKCKLNYFAIIVAIFLGTIFLSGIVIIVVKKINTKNEEMRRGQEINGEILRHRIRGRDVLRSNRHNDIIINNRDNHSGSSNYQFYLNEIEGLSEEKLIKKYKEEFNEKKYGKEDDKNMCEYCLIEPASFISSCGCRLCKNHSKGKQRNNLNKNSTNNSNVNDITNRENYINNKNQHSNSIQNSHKKIKISLNPPPDAIINPNISPKIQNVCFRCEKVISSIDPIKKNCGICFQEVNTVVGFKCGCALRVCEDCFIKCKISNIHCPACRRVIN